MSKIDELTKLIVKLIDERLKKKPKSYDVKAEVLRIEGGKAYVHIPNGVTETPVDMTIDAEVGDTVQVRVGGHRAWLTGNSSRPPTDDAEALVAKAVAKIADKNAATAKDAAEEALEEAGAGITVDTLHYLATDLSSGVTINTPGWTTTAQAITTAKPYLWTYHTYNKASGITVDTDPVITGVYGTSGTPGAKWYTGTGITGTSTTATIFPSSGVSSAVVGDMYLNTSTSNTYRCTTAGAASVAKWVYVNNIQGEEGPQGPTGPAGPGISYVTLQAGDDINNCIGKDTIYVTSSTAVCNALDTNYPGHMPSGFPAGELQLEVIWMGDNNYLVQRLTCKNGATRKVYLRTYSSGTFGEWTEEGVSYGSSSTAASTAAKTATISNWNRDSDPYVAIKFTNENTASSPTLNINSTGAASIMTNGSNSAYWAAGAVVNFYWDGTYYQVANTPVYASTVTVGNPNGDNVFIGNSAVQVKQGSSVKAEFKATEASLGGNKAKVKYMEGQAFGQDSHRIVVCKSTHESGVRNDATLSSRDLENYNASTDYMAFVNAGHYDDMSTIHLWALAPTIGNSAEINLFGTSTGSGVSIGADLLTANDIDVGSVKCGPIDSDGGINADEIDCTALKIYGYEIPYITEKGTKTGGWYYEKWSSGKVEAWGKVSTGTLPSMSGGNRVYMATGVNGSIPSGIFTSTPTFMEAFCHYANAACYSVWASPTSSTGFQMQVVKNANNTGSVDVQIHAVYYPNDYA